MKRKEVVTAIERPLMRCPDCEVGHMHLTLITDADGRILYRRQLSEHSVAYLDSG